MMMNCSSRCIFFAFGLLPIFLFLGGFNRGVKCFGFLVVSEVLRGPATGEDGVVVVSVNVPPISVGIVFKLFGLGDNVFTLEEGGRILGVEYLVGVVGVVGLFGD